MVLYFSATGNTRYIAQELANSLEDSSLDLLDRIRSKDHSPVFSDKPYVICSPVYVCEMPRFQASYLNSTPLEGNRDIYFVFTSGGYAGISSVLARKMARKKNMRYMGSAEIQMPRNYIASDAYPELDETEIRRRIRNARQVLPRFAEAIRAKNRLYSRHVWLAELIITLPFNPVWCRLMQGVGRFKVTDRCIGCGKCSRICPLNIIRTGAGNKPVWTGRNCAHCMSCIQNCPVDAIEYGNITEKKDRYRFEKYKG